MRRVRAAGGAASGFLASVAIAAVVLSTPSTAADSMPLSLNECLGIALENNLDLISARIDPEISEQNIASADADYDAVFEAGTSYFDQLQEVTQISQPDSITSTSANAKITQNLRTGGNVSVELTGTDTTLTGDPLFFASSTTITSELRLNASIPLLNGRGKEVTTERLLLAKTSLDISKDELRRQTEQTIEQVEGAYWDVLAAVAALDVARQSLARAEDLLEQNRKKVEVGTLAPIEITQAEAGVASEVEGVILAETTLRNAEDELRRLMAIPQDDPRWELPIDITDQPDFSPVEPDLEAVIADALANRAEMDSARKTLDNDELSERVARKRLKHNLTLGLNYTPEGTDVDDMTGGASLIDALDETGQLDNRSWSTSLTYSIPLGNKAAKAGYRIAQLETRRSRVALDSQEQAIRVEARRAVRDVLSGTRRVDAARTNVRLQTEKLEAEQKKFENGMSTSFEVLTFQNDLNDAELARIRALLDYTKALVALDRVRGSLLEARGLRLSPPAGD